MRPGGQRKLVVLVKILTRGFMKFVNGPNKWARGDAHLGFKAGKTRVKVKWENLG
jgi:hypothetical protein